MTEKTRDLPLLQFLEVLQIEYVVAELRSKVYYKAKDKTYWRERVMSGKQQKISDIVSRNPGIPTIFNSPQEKERIKSVVIPEFGFPNFHYKDEEQRLELEFKDYQNYYSKNSEVRVKVSEKEVKTGNSIYLSPDRQFLTVKFKGEEKKSVVHVSNVSRII